MRFPISGARGQIAVASALPPFFLPSSIRPVQRRARRLLALMIAVSAGLHVMLLAAVPGLVSETRAIEPHVLEVVLVQPEVLPIETAQAPALPEPVKPKSAPRPKQPAPKRTESVNQPEQNALPRAEPPSSKEAGSPEAVTVPPRASAPESKAVPAPSSAPPAEAPAQPALTPPVFSASYLRNPAPRYPPVARRSGAQGTVTLRVLVTKDGVPARVTVEQTSGSPHLDAAALEAVKTWRFVPARRGADAVEAWVLVPIVFRLESAS
ncbi:MAG: TonB family protein [Betaproteobacteria bacterium]